MEVCSNTRALVVALLLAAPVEALAASPVVVTALSGDEVCCFSGSEDASLSAAISHDSNVLIQLASAPTSRFYVQVTFSNGDRATFFRAFITGSPQYLYVRGTAKDKNGKKICYVPGVISPLDPDVLAKDVCDPKPVLQITWIGCTGLTPRYTVTWWSGSLGGPIESFTVQRKVGSTWQAYWAGGETCTLLTTSSSILNFRVMGTNDSSTSTWVNLSLNGAVCDGSGTPP